MQRMPLKSRWGKIYILWHLNKKCKHRASATCLAGTDGDRLTFVTALRKVLGDICYRLLPCALDMDKKPCEDNRTNVPSVFDHLHKQQAFSLYSLREYCGSSQLSKACHRESSYKIHCKTNSQKNTVSLVDVSAHFLFVLFPLDFPTTVLMWIINDVLGTWLWQMLLYSTEVSINVIWCRSEATEEIAAMTFPFQSWSLWWSLESGEKMSKVILSYPAYLNITK